MIKILKTVTGIDISGSSIKIAVARRILGSVPVLNLAESRILPGAISRGRIRDQGMLEVALLSVLKNLRPGTNLSTVVFSPPEEITFLHPVMLGYKDGETTEKKVVRELSCLIPLPLSELYYDFKIIDLPDNRKVALVFAVIKKELDAWCDFLWRFRIRVDGFEPGAGAISRYLNNPKNNGWILLDIGRLSSGVYAFYGSHPLYSSTEQVGGKKYFDRIRTENTRKGYKLDDYDLKNFNFTSIENRLEALKEVVEPLRALIFEAGDSFERLLGTRPKEVLIVGGFSRHPELIRSLRERIPEYNIIFGKGAFARGYGESAVSFAQAIGLAVKGLDTGQGHESVPSIRISKSAVVEQEKVPEKKTAGRNLSRLRFEKLYGRFPVWAGLFSVIGLFALFIAYAFIPKIYHNPFSPDKKEISGELSKTSIKFSVPVNFGFSRQEGSIRAEIVTIKSGGGSLSAGRNTAFAQAKQLAKKDDMLLRQPYSEADNGAGEYEFTFFKLKREDALLEISRKAEEVIGTDQFITDKINIVKAVKREEHYAFEGNIDVSYKLVSGLQELQATSSGLSMQVTASSTLPIESISVPLPSSTTTQEQTNEPIPMRVKDLGGKKLNVRENPSASAKIVSKLEQRITVEVIETAEGWAKIRLQDGEQGWVMEQFLEN